MYERKTMNIAAQRFTWLYAKSLLKLKYRYTSLGFLWNFLEPALFLTVLSVVFSVVNRMNTSDYAVFLFGALVPWRYFEKVVTTCMDSIAGGEWLLKKMYVSPLALPLTRWIVASVEFLFSLVIVFALFAVLKDNWTVHLLILPLAILPWAMLGLGIGLVCAVLYTFFRDIRTIVQMVLMLSFFSSPILFKADLFHDHSLQSLIVRYHPITYFAALFQKPVYYGMWPGIDDWLVTTTVGTVSLLVGLGLVNKYKDKFYFYL
ncbi:MAG: Transport permease protein [Bacteroidetes bacterium]|nr:Transport permease protein [Bacteroidota bacterium]